MIYPFNDCRHVRNNLFEIEDQDSVRIGNELSVIQVILSKHIGWSPVLSESEIGRESGNGLSNNENGGHTAVNCKLQLRWMVDVARE